MTEILAHESADVLDTRRMCKALLQHSLELTGTSLGNVQLVDWPAKELEIVAQQGFQADFLAFFARVSLSQTCACARALISRAPVLIGDVASDAAFAPYRDMADRAGFRAVQSTPLLSSSGALVGIVSTHFPAPHIPTEAELARLQEVSRHAANAIIYYRARRPLHMTLLRSLQAMESSADLLRRCDRSS